MKKIYIVLSIVIIVTLSLCGCTEPEAAKTDNDEKGKDQGILLGSGLIAGEGLMGVVIAVIAVVISKSPKYLEITYSTQWIGEIVSVIAFVILGWYLYNVAAK